LAVLRFRARNRWLLLKVPVLTYLAWFYFLPITWRVIVLFCAAVISAFVSPSPGGPAVTGTHLSIMFWVHLLELLLAGWCVVNIFAYLEGPQLSRRLLGACGVLLAPVVFLVAVVLVGLSVQALGVPDAQIWKFTDRWTPVPAWRVGQ
jgi:hypothetical protein